MFGINFNKSFYIKPSDKGEQNLEACEVYVALNGEPASYINITHRSPFGKEHRLPLSPSQARETAELLWNYACQHDEKILNVTELGFKIPLSKTLIARTRGNSTYSESNEITVSIDQTNITLSQPVDDNVLNNHEVSVSKIQFESLLRQLLKHDPSFKTHFYKLLKNTV